ncbi:MAG: carbohydrate-binding protein, partial [Bacteroides sp.]|nr:carbohydrate-binding protein [Bacteroides sp.]
EENKQEVIISTASPLLFGKTILLSYSGTSIQHESQLLPDFEDQKVLNNMARHFPVPARIQAEDFFRNNGLLLEGCSEGGYNTAYANVGDYLDYILNVEEEGDYDLDFRIATERSGAKLSIQADYGEGFKTIQSKTFSRTGGWQTWTTQGTTLHLDTGKFMLRLLVTGAEHNLNWFQFKKAVGISQTRTPASFSLYPNPARGSITVNVKEATFPVKVEIVDMQGRVVYQDMVKDSIQRMDISALPAGLYFVRLGEEGSLGVEKLILN